VGSLPSDDELMQAVGAGDRRAFEEIVRRHEQRAWTIAYHFLGCRDEAEDIVQDAFLRVLGAASRYHPSAAFRTYLQRIVIRLCLDHAKKREPVCVDELPERADPADGALDSLVEGERARVIHMALERLPANQRMAIVLKYFENLSYREIADAMRITEKSTDRLLARGRAALAASLSRWREP
jgi:RNA polymerase sigma-70 factor (ECF subfamily)